MCSVWDVCRLLAWRLCYTLQSRQDSTSHTQQLLPKIKRTPKRHSARVIDVKDASNSHAWQLTNVYICVRQQTTSAPPPSTFPVSALCFVYIRCLQQVALPGWRMSLSYTHAYSLTKQMYSSTQSLTSDQCRSSSTRVNDGWNWERDGEKYNQRCKNGGIGR